MRWQMHSRQKSIRKRFDWIYCSGDLDDEHQSISRTHARTHPTFDSTAEEKNKIKNKIKIKKKKELQFCGPFSCIFFLFLFLLLLRALVYLFLYIYILISCVPLAR